MLIRFSVENFLSIREKQEISFIPSSIKERLDSNNLAETTLEGFSLLRSIGIFGPNSSGKSNIFKTLVFIKYFVTESAITKHSHAEINVKPFLLHKDTLDKPTEFEIEFLLDDLIYKYGLKVSSLRVLEEYAYYRKRKKDFLLFHRKSDEYSFGNKLKSVEDLQERTRFNVSFLSVLAQFNFPLATKIVEWFNKIRFLRDELNLSLIHTTAELFKNPKYNVIIERILKNADLGFKEIKTSNENNLDLIKELVKSQLIKNENASALISRLNMRTVHNLYDRNGAVVGDQELDISVESLGTQKYISMVGRIAEVLINGGVLFIDEIDARLHAFLCASILNYFNSHINNPNNAQLIFISHNAYLMKNHLLRRDQIYITDKDKYESTTIGTLINQKIRNDMNYEKVYLAGKLKGTPNINSQLDLFSNK